MFTKTCEITRKGEWLYLSPKLEDKVLSSCKVKSYNHFVQEKYNLTPNNIIDLRNDIIKNKIQGQLDIFIQFYDKGDDYPEIPEDIELNPYLIDYVWCAPLNRNISNNGKNFIYKYHDDMDDEENEYINLSEPLLNLEVSFDDYPYPYYTSKYIFDQNYNTNLIHVGRTFYLDYKTDIANEKNYIITESASKNGWGFFEIGVRTPNYTTYTPQHAELIVKLASTNNFYSVPEALEVTDITDDTPCVVAEIYNE